MIKKIERILRKLRKLEHEVKHAEKLRYRSRNSSADFSNSLSGSVNHSRPSSVVKRVKRVIREKRHTLEGKR